MRNSFSTASLAVAMLLAACGARAPDVPAPSEPLGDFRMGFNVVVVGDAMQGPGSQTVDPGILETSIETAVANRLGAYSGDGLYHLGIRVEGYVLPEPGARSDAVLLMAANVWDESTQQKLTATPIEVTGTVRAAAPTLAQLADSAAQELEQALRDNAGRWFAPKPGQTRIPFDPDARQATVASPPN